jgi:hypothetical protein
MRGFVLETEKGDRRPTRATIQYGPRQAYVGRALNSYRVSLKSSDKIPDFLVTLKQRIEEKYNCYFNSVQINKNFGHNSVIGPRSDAAPGHICILSVGAERDFVLSHRHNNEPFANMKLADGSLLTLFPEGQDRMQISMPQCPVACGPRYALIFRYIPQIMTEKILKTKDEKKQRDVEYEVAQVKAKAGASAEPIFPDIVLEFCSRSDPRYQAFRDRDYVENHGAIGQQVHFLIWYKRPLAGIISGGSAVYGVASRDNSFSITKQNRKKFMTSIINNNVFRMEYHNDKRMITKSGRDVPVESVATRVLALWRKVIPFLWFDIYAAIPCGFETFVGETEKRKGSVYKSDNWEYVGRTVGSSKSRKGLTNALVREKVEPKLVYVKKSDDYSCFAECGDPRFDPSGYKPSWPGKTPAEKQLAKDRAKRRKYLEGRVFFLHKVGGFKSVSFTRKEFIISNVEARTGNEQVSSEPMVVAPAQ